MIMKAARWFGKKDIRIVNIESDKLKENDVKILIKYAGICGSDLHEYLHGPIGIPVKHEHPYSNMMAPVTMGHEFCGKVVEVGANVKHIKVGDRVVVEPILTKNGLVGEYNLDPHAGCIGLVANGGFAEYCVVDAGVVHILPDDIDYEQGALTEPAAVALYAVRRSHFKAGDIAVVFGCGPIGLLVIESLRVAGARKIYAVELSPERQAKARELNAIVIDPNEVDPVSYLKEVTNGGPDVSFEVTGVASVLNQAIQTIKNNGECIIVSIWSGEVAINPNLIVTKEKTIKGTIGYRHIFPAVLDLMSQGYFSKDILVTKKIKLDDIVEEGFETLIKEKNHVKILVSPTNYSENS